MNILIKQLLTDVSQSLHDLPVPGPYCSHHHLSMILSCAGFDGDGMLHACRIKDGKVSYCNRFVDTFRLAQEEQFGSPLYVKLGDLRGMAGMAHISLNEMRTRMGLAPMSVSRPLDTSFNLSMCTLT